MNPMDLFRLKGFWDRFSAAHPKLVPFWKSVYPAAFGEGTIVDVKITDAKSFSLDGEAVTSSK